MTSPTRPYRFSSLENCTKTVADRADGQPVAVRGGPSEAAAVRGGQQPMDTGTRFIAPLSRPRSCRQACIGSEFSPSWAFGPVFAPPRQ